MTRPNFMPFLMAFALVSVMTMTTFSDADFESQSSSFSYAECDRLVSKYVDLRVKRAIARPHIADYIKLYLNKASAEALARISNEQIRVKHLDYDKALNEQ